MKSFLLFLSITFFLFKNSSADSTNVQICHSYGFYGYDYYDKYVERFDALDRLILQANYHQDLSPYSTPDSVFNLVDKTEFGYNMLGLIDSVLKTDVQMTYINYYHTDYVYDANGNLVEKYELAGATFPLDTNFKTIYLYDVNNNLIEQRFEVYISNQQYWASDIEHWGYDAQGNLVDYNKTHYNNSSHLDSIYESNVYSATGKILLYKIIYYTAFPDSSYKEYIYDSSDSLIILNAYDADSGAWVPNYRTYYSYPPNSMLTFYCRCLTPACGDTTSWTTLNYDSTGHVTFENWTNWGGDSNTIIYTYDTYGNLIVYETHSVVPGCDVFEYTTYVYNSANDLLESHSSYDHCNIMYTDCFYYNLDQDSILVSVELLDTICANQFSPLIITVEGGTPPYQFDWTPGTFLSDSTILNPFLVNQDSTIIYQLLVTDSLGKTASDSVYVHVLPDLFVPITVSSIGPPCEYNASLTFSPIPSGYFVEWLFPTSPYTHYGDTVQSTSNGQYTLWLTDYNGCNYAYPFTLNLSPAPNVNLGTDTTLCANDTLMIDAGNFTAYDWNTGATSSSIMTYSAVTDTDTFIVIVTDNNNCINSDSIVVNYITCTGIRENEFSDINIYTNHSLLFIDFINETNLSFVLTDVNGREVLKKEFKRSSVIDISDLKNGIYFYRINEFRTGRLIVMN